MTSGLPEWHKASFPKLPVSAPFAHPMQPMIRAPFGKPSAVQSWLRDSKQRPAPWSRGSAPAKGPLARFKHKKSKKHKRSRHLRKTKSYLFFTITLLLLSHMCHSRRCHIFQTSLSSRVVVVPFPHNPLSFPQLPACAVMGSPPAERGCFQRSRFQRGTAAHLQQATPRCRLSRQHCSAVFSHLSHWSHQ